MMCPVVPQAGPSQLNAELNEIKKAGNVPQKIGIVIFFSGIRPRFALSSPMWI